VATTTGTGAAEPPPVCVVPADADTGAVHALGDYRGFMLIGADKGLFLARERTAGSRSHPVPG
jgi:hypothetical protein